MSTIAEHAAALAELEDIADDLLARGDVEAAAGAAQTAAAIAVMNHPGRFASARLDRVLLAAAESLGPAPAWTGGSSPHGPRRVLHVLSHATAQGGHTRLAARWIARDAGRRHSLVVTAPIEDTPSVLLDAVRASGGTEHEVFDANSHLFDDCNALLVRARNLRDLALDHDAVVLYLDPHDPLPAIALGGLSQRPPVLACDVTEHTFGLGRIVVDLHVAARDQSVWTAVERRGLPARRCAILPLPVEAPSTDGVRARVRSSLGLADDDVLMLTVGAAYKYETAGGPHLLDLVTPVLEARPNVRLVAAGPDETGRWAVARADTGGRLRALGVVESAPLVAAADVVLESYPCGGGTFALEAASAGRAMLGYAPDDDEAAILSARSMSCGGWEYPATPESFRAALTALVDDPAARAAAGARAERATRLSHDRAAWAAEVAELYAAARALGPIAPGELGDPPHLAARDSEIVHALHVTGSKLIDPVKVSNVTARVRLQRDVPAFTGAFMQAIGGFPLPRHVFGRAVAAPEPDPAAVAVAVERLRDVSVGRLAARCVLVVDPVRVGELLPAIEAAFDAGAEFDLDVTPAADPCTVLDFDTLPVPVPGDRLAAAGVAFA